MFELDMESGELRRHGLKVRLPDQSFQILKALLSRPGEVVTRDQLRQVLWTSDTFVDFEVGLNSAVRKLREALDDAADNPKFVETLPRRGYRFVASVSQPVPVLPAAAAPAADDALAVNALRKEVDVPTPPAGVAASNLQAAEPRSGGSSPAPDRSAFRAWPVVLSLAGIVALAAVIYQQGIFGARRGTAAAAPIRSLVVLPFENLTGTASEEYFVDSVTDAVTAHLTQINDLDVISRTSARQYKQTSKRLPEIGAELGGVDGVVEGAVMRSASGVRITVKLIRAATDRNLWADSYDGDMTGMLALQQQIAFDVAAAAGRPLPDARAQQVVNPRAYDAYVRGLTARGFQRAEGFLRAVTYFEEAVAIQPDFAEAYAALAQAQLQLLFGGPLSPHQTVPKVEVAARKALALDDTLSEAHRALAQVLLLYHWRWEEGARALERAEAMRPGRDEVSVALIQPLIRSGRVQDAIAAAERGRKLDPLSVSAQIAVGSAYRAAGQHERALAEFRQALVMSPGTNRANFQLGITYVAMGRLDDAVRELETAVRVAQGHNTRMEGYLGYAYAAAGRPKDARDMLRELEGHRRVQYVSSFGIALIHDALGEKAPALAALERACNDRAVEFAQLQQYPAFKTIASEPRYLAVMQKVGLPR